MTHSEGKRTTYHPDQKKRPLRVHTKYIHIELYIYIYIYILLLLLLLFLTFSALFANPKKLLYTVANPARGLLNMEKKRKRKSLAAHPPPPRALLVRRKKEKKEITRRIHISRRYASRRHAGGLGPSRIRTRLYMYIYIYIIYIFDVLLI